MLAAQLSRIVGQKSKREPDRFFAEHNSLHRKKEQDKTGLAGPNAALACPTPIMVPLERSGCHRKLRKTALRENTLPIPERVKPPKKFWWNTPAVGGQHTNCQFAPIVLRASKGAPGRSLRFPRSLAGRVRGRAKNCSSLLATDLPRGCPRRHEDHAHNEIVTQYAPGHRKACSVQHRNGLCWGGGRGTLIQSIESDRQPPANSPQGHGAAPGES